MFRNGVACANKQYRKRCQKKSPCCADFAHDGGGGGSEAAGAPRTDPKTLPAKPQPPILKALWMNPSIGCLGVTVQEKCPRRREQSQGGNERERQAESEQATERARERERAIRREREREKEREREREKERERDSERKTAKERVIERDIE